MTQSRTGAGKNQVKKWRKLLYFALAMSAGVGMARSASAQTPLTYEDSQGNKVVFPLGARSFADKVVSFTKGKPFTTDPRAQDPNKTLGVPDLSADEYENYLALGTKGMLTVEFTNNYLVDVPGPDLWVFEIGPVIEATDIAISKDGKTWVHVGRVAGATAGIDIGPKVKPADRFSFVRLIDVDNNIGDWPGADIDAIGAIGSIARETSTPAPSTPATSSPATPANPTPTAQKPDAAAEQKCTNQLRIEMKDGSVILIDLDKVARIIPTTK